ncbi:MAG: TraR/DksA family transcriptional regulator [Chthoniobacterales bacterium]
MATPKKKSAPAKKKPASSKAATKRSQAPAKKQSSSRAAKSTKPAAAKKNAVHKHNNNSTPAAVLVAPKARERKLDPFTRAQKERLLQLRDAMVDSMAGVAQDTLRSRAEGSEASAFGMHQADAGSDAYDRDFALSLLSQEQDALYEIDQALKRIELGTYGVCEMCSKPISRARLEAIPFTRFTVDCQSQLEKQNKASRVRQSVTSLFGLTDDEGGETEEEEAPAAKSEE